MSLRAQRIDDMQCMHLGDDFLSLNDAKNVH